MSKIPLIASIFFFAVNFAIGDTIFANVIVLFLSFVLGLVALIIAIVGVAQNRVTGAPYVSLVLSATILIAIVVLVATDNVAVGYGP